MTRKDSKMPPGEQTSRKQWFVANGSEPRRQGKFETLSLAGLLVILILIVGTLSLGELRRMGRLSVEDGAKKLIRGGH